MLRFATDGSVIRSHSSPDPISWDAFFEGNFSLILWLGFFAACAFIAYLVYFGCSFRKHTLTVYSDGEISSRRVRHKRTYSAPLLQKEGYVFKGWYRDSAMQLPFDSSMRITTDISIYAKFEPKE
ncbi:MAG: InlB B-repeat-containing protein [Clostridia bacterium]|nr:InlB B-repeat-containing protein [Clostridia bacterium]